MNLRHVVAAVEIIVDEYFPIAVDRVDTPLKPMQSFEIQGLKPFNEIASEKCFERPISRLQAGKYPVFPDCDLHGNESARGAIEIGDAGKFRCQ